MTWKRALVITLAGAFAAEMVAVMSVGLLNQGYWSGWIGIPLSIAIVAATAYELIRGRDEAT